MKPKTPRNLSSIISKISLSDRGKIVEYLGEIYFKKDVRGAVLKLKDEIKFKIKSIEDYVSGLDKKEDEQQISNLIWKKTMLYDVIDEIDEIFGSDLTSEEKK